MSVTIQKLQQLRDGLRRQQQNRASEEGRLAQLVADLKKRHGCSSVSGAKVKLAATKKERERIEAEVRQGLAKLSTAFPTL